jgi:hypothetical protein
MPKDYTFNPDTGEFVATRDFNSTNPTASQNDISQQTQRGSDPILNGQGIQPPSTFAVDADPYGQVVFVSPDGTVTVDVTILVQDGIDTGEYEVRVTK